MCLSMFSGVSLAKAYSPLTARELSSGEHAQRQAEAAHAERKAEKEPKAEEERKAKEDAEAEDEGSTPSATVDGKVVVCAVPSIDMTCAQCVENVAIVHQRFASTRHSASPRRETRNERSRRFQHVHPPFASTRHFASPLRFSPFLTQVYSPPPALGAPLLTQDEDAGDTGRDREMPSSSGSLPYGSDPYRYRPQDPPPQPLPQGPPPSETPGEEQPGADDETPM